MARIYNFSAGPAAMPEEVLREAAAELTDYRGRGMSVMEMSHRGDDFQAIFTETKSRLTRLFALPEGYRILFLQGGASLQFAMVAMNLLSGGSADYVHTGVWSKKAIAEARRFGTVRVAASGEETGFSRIPRQEELDLDVPAGSEGDTIEVEREAAVETTAVVAASPVEVTAEDWQGEGEAEESG